DLGPFQQYQSSKNDPLVIYQPDDAYRVNGGSSLDVPGMDFTPGLGTNPSNGAVIYYDLAQKVDTSQRMQMDILDASGEVIRTYTNQKDKKFRPYEGGPAPAPLLSGKLGLNRFVWDLRRDGIPAIPGVFVFGDYRGHRVAPGTYTIRLTVDSLEQSTRVEVLGDPRLEVSAADYAQQQNNLGQIENSVIDIHQSINRLRNARQQVRDLLEILGDEEKYQPLADSGRSVMKTISEWEKNLIQPQQKTFQDVINYPNKLNAEFLFLRNVMDSHDPRATEGAKIRLGELLSTWNKYKNELSKIINEDVADFNKMFKQMDLDRIIIPEENQEGNK
ncbi:MAG: glycosyl hydrolase, partial [Bacteroidota bacterium]